MDIRTLITVNACNVQCIVLGDVCNLYVQEKLGGSERKKLQTLQPSSKNQALLVRVTL